MSATTLQAKNSNSECVINILVPRKHWDPIERFRTETTPDQRCGPHISFVDPFVQYPYFPEAAQILKEALRDFPPFQMTLFDLDYFAHKSSATAFLVPKTNPPDAIEQLSLRLLSLFPHCNDLRKRSGKLVPHISVGKFRNKMECVNWIAEVKKTLSPSSFMVNEIYLLHRTGGDPFEVSHSIPLGQSSAQPAFGLGSVPDRSHPIARSAFIGGFSKHITEENAAQYLELIGVEQSYLNSNSEDFKFSVLKNPNGSSRGILVVQFSSVSILEGSIENFTPPTLEQVTRVGIQSIYLPTGKLPYIQKLELMAFPDAIGGCAW